MKKPNLKRPSFTASSTRRRISGSRGFTLLEVLIATLVLAVGLLGIAGLQVTGQRSNASSLMRTQATLFATDIAERMRANNLGFRAGDYNLAAATAHAGCTSIAGCTAAEMAENDMSAWSANINNTLPAGVGIVCIDSTPVDGASSTVHACDGNGTDYVIKIWWQDDRTAALRRFVVAHM